MTRKMLLILIEVGFLIIAILFMSLSSFNAYLLVAGLGVLTAFFGIASYLAIRSYRNNNKEARNAQLQELLDEQESEFDDVEIITKKQRTHNDKIYLVVFSIVATIVSAYMFVRLLII